jgi:hypothetical protein
VRCIVTGFTCPTAPLVVTNKVTTSGALAFSSAFYENAGVPTPPKLFRRGSL